MLTVYLVRHGQTNQYVVFRITLPWTGADAPRVARHIAISTALSKYAQLAHPFLVDEFR